MAAEWVGVFFFPPPEVGLNERAVCCFWQSKCATWLFPHELFFLFFNQHISHENYANQSLSYALNYEEKSLK